MKPTRCVQSASLGATLKEDQYLTNSITSSRLTETLLRYLIVRSRKRITVDGGHSITATNPYLDTDGMPKSSKGSTFSSPESVTDPIEPLNLSRMSESDDIG